MVLAGLVAKGKTQVSGLNHLDRGYAGIKAKLTGSGARLERHGSEPQDLAHDQRLMNNPPC